MSQRHYDALAVKPLRIAIVFLGLVLALYGVASLTGGWLGEPPWWVVRREVDDLTWILMQGKPFAGSVMDRTYVVLHARPGREWISAGVVGAGLALAFAARPKRAPHPPRGLDRATQRR